MSEDGGSGEECVGVMRAKTDTRGEKGREEGGGRGE